MGKVRALCISEKKGTAKQMIDKVELVANHGLANDAHAGNWHRQVSLLAVEKIDAFNAQGGQVQFGDFGENIVVEGYALNELPVGQRLQIGDTLLEVSQIGKECHTRCAIFYRVGQCIMPTNGIFAVVLVGGEIKVGDSVTLV